ncbi:hypothetical protein NQ176_g5458 [Zarea fungicola]|uniref:Uncharacterized protein n=1 Tax=Zarea fungicola TaxID=93591 RepID=A0ACC1N9A9_9HYPO|nr:hypothetical protein NQ176_g5458 [Lecanicillium fungicola]
MDPASAPPPPPPLYSHHPPATRDDQLMSQTRSLAVANCRRVDAPTALSGPLPRSTPRHDASSTSGTRTPTSLAIHRSISSDAQPLAAATGIPQESLSTAVDPRAWTYTPVSLSRDLSPSLSIPSLQTMPAEILLQILGYLDVCDLLPTSRVSDGPQLPRLLTPRDSPTLYGPMRQRSPFYFGFSLHHRPQIPGITHPSCFMQIHVADHHAIRRRHVTTFVLSAWPLYCTNTASGALGSPSLLC